MPVIVAVITPLPGKTEAVLDAFRTVSPKVFEEPGCELYAAHTDGELVIMVERWTTQADIDGHNAGAALVELGGLFEGLLASPTVVHVLENVPIGAAGSGEESGKGTIA